MSQTHTLTAVVLGILIGGGFLLWQNSTNSPDIRSLVCYPESEANLEQHIASAYACLGQQRVSQSASTYQSVIEAVDIGLARFDEQPELLIIKAQAAMNLHEFGQAYTLAETAIALDPSPHYYYGVLGDAALELGRYDAAEQAYQTMADIRPDFGVFVRIAYFRELNGDIEGALLALTEASSAGAAAIDMAWLRSEQGRLLRTVDLERSSLAYDQALAIMPDYSPAKLGLSQNRWYQGSTTEAIAMAEDLYTADATIGNAIALGDMYFIAGETKKAAQLYAVAEAALMATEQQGQNIDRDLAAFAAVRGFSSENILSRAKRAYATQPNILSQISYARLLLHTGDGAAATAIIEPLLTDSIGQHDPTVWLVAGLIAEAADQNETAEQYYTTAKDVPAELGLRDRSLVITK